MNRPKHVEVRLTEREAEVLRSLVYMVLSNSDQWDFMDLSALRRVANKVDP